MGACLPLDYFITTAIWRNEHNHLLTTQAHRIMQIMPKTGLVDIYMVVMLLEKRPLAAILENVLTNVLQETNKKINQRMKRSQ